ncbi:MAG: NifU family protein [Salibacteraceae bacterium]|jgi:NFU1 iron-sulfur cluster scaffold homolog, mitochondrial|nr:NifU family protein [Salibacteraceae bacterium]MDP4687091.1 NifU family protein [Salibacteraceae bacterium]MDP4764534.1 NifU family protein [Salibacteraceae bacterium]
MSKSMPYMIYAEVTPNPATMKFVANHNLAQNGHVYEYTSEAAAKSAPLAQRLFTFPFTRGVFIAQNFVTITKMDGIEWDEIMLELREYISNFLNSGHDVFLPEAEAEANEAKAESGMTAHAKADTPIEEQIVDILDDYVRPAVEGDGGAIHFKSYADGKLTVVLKGSCSGCPSSTVTLKAGIQSLFERMLPEVKEVVAEEE